MDVTVPRWLVERPIAHRGLHGTSTAIPENSLAAFEAAATMGFAAELDVRATSDGVAVVFHDVELERMTGVEGTIDAVDSDGVGLLKLGGTRQAVPLLAGVLATVVGRVPLLVEVKNEGVVGVVEEATLAALDGYAGPVAVQSFNPLTLQWFAHHVPELPRGLLAGDFRDVDMNPTLKGKLRDLEMLDIAAPHFVGYDVRCLPFEPLTRLRAAGMPVIGWTVTSTGMEADALRSCDNVIFEGYVPAG
jgi:glycerophosphoryl diester phosphodiesterase